MHCCMTFVTKNKFLLIYFRSFLLFCFFLSVFLSQIYFYIHFRHHSGNTTALIGPWHRIGSPAVQFIIHSIFLHWKAFFVPKNPNLYIILSSRLKRIQKLFRKFGGMVDVKFRKQLCYEHTDIQGSLLVKD